MTCISGDCSGSACSRFSGILEPCNCIVDMELATDEEKKKHCHVCCQAVGAPETCKSTGELMAYFNSTGSNRTIFRQPGSPCDDYKGYCDVFSKCRSVDADGPLARLKKALFNPVLYSNIKEWIVVSIIKRTMNNNEIDMCLGILVGCTAHGTGSYYADGCLCKNLFPSHPVEQSKYAKA